MGIVDAWNASVRTRGTGGRSWTAGEADCAARWGQRALPKVAGIAGWFALPYSEL